jgi:hypothetical protein
MEILERNPNVRDIYPVMQLHGSQTTAIVNVEPRNAYMLDRHLQWFLIRMLCEGLEAKWKQGGLRQMAGPQVPKLNTGWCIYGEYHFENGEGVAYRAPVKLWKMTWASDTLKWH